MLHTFDIFYSNLETSLQPEDKSKAPVLLEFNLTVEENPVLVTSTTGWVVPPVKQNKVAAAFQTFNSDNETKASLVKELGLLNLKYKNCPKFKLNKRGLSDAIEFSRTTFSDHMTIICDTKFNWDFFALGDGKASPIVMEQFRIRVSRHEDADDPYHFRFFDCDVVTVPSLGAGLYVAKDDWFSNVSLGKYRDQWVGLVRNAKHLILPVIS